MAGIEDAEREFEARLDAFGGDARGCAILAYTGFAFTQIAGSDLAIHDRLNRHPAFWNALVAGLQSSAFVALGRIFDRSRNTYNGAALLDFAEKNLGIFSWKAREARDARRGRPWAKPEERAARAFELRPGGLDDLRHAFEAKRRVFEDKAESIRNQIYAHTGKRSAEDRDAMFNRLPLRDLEDLVVFPLRVERAMFQLYHNGAPPILDPAPSLITKVIDSLPKRGVSNWEHLHAAKNVVAFFDWLRETPRKDE